MSMNSLLRHPENAGLPAKSATTYNASPRWAKAKLPAEKAYLALDFRLQSSASLNINTHQRPMFLSFSQAFPRRKPI
jgi:hypothetical protein